MLDDNAANLLVVDVKELDPREDLHDMAHSSKGVVAKVHYLRNAHKTNGKPLTVDNAINLLHWKAFFKLKAIRLDNGLEIQSRALDISTLRLLN